MGERGDVTASDKVVTKNGQAFPAMVHYTVESIEQRSKHIYIPQTQTRLCRNVEIWKPPDAAPARTWPSGDEYAGQPGAFDSVTAKCDDCEGH